MHAATTRHLFIAITALTLVACAPGDPSGDDAGTPDAADATDAGRTPDAGTTPDAGPTPDAGGGGGGTGTGAVGDPCETEADCAGGDPGYCIPATAIDDETGEPFETGFTNGYCTLDCGADPTICPEGSTCYEYDVGVADCLKTCASNAECRVDDGYECDGDNTCYPTF